MKDKVNLLDIVQRALGTFEHRQSFTPGMFEPLTPLFKELGYESAAIYITDDYPDRMHLACACGTENTFPPHVALNKKKTLFDEIRRQLGKLPGFAARRLFNHERELGVLAVICDNADDPRTGEELDVLAKSISVMAYVERIRTNARRERQERDIFFAQSLINRILPRGTPKVKELRLGFELIRSLEAGGDFFDFMPEKNGGLLGFLGCCNGNGLRTALEVTSIMQTIYHACHDMRDLTSVIKEVNTFLVKEKRRAHQASLAFFHIDVTARKLRVAKSGRIGMLLCGPGKEIDNISAPGAMYLGMMDNPDIHSEEYPFSPGQSLFCVTEGFYVSRNVMNVTPQLHWFNESLAATLESRRRKPLANAVFDLVNRTNDFTARPDNSMLALSVEFTGKNRESVRIRN